MADFLARLKQRKLVQWAIAYGAFAFALIQILDVVADSYQWPRSAMHIVFGLLALGLVVALLLAWYHGEKGAQRVSGPELLLIALVLVVGGGLLWHFGGAASTTSRNPAKVVTSSVAGATSSENAPAAVTHAASASAITIPAKSIAVLPFANESGNKDEQFFSDGLSDDLITALSQFAGLKVISRNSAFQFRDSRDSSARIGRLLGVAHLLEGSVQRSENEVRVTATLVNAADGSILWSQRYDKPYKDLFALQDDITRSVADALQAKLLTAPGAVVQSDRPSDGNVQAYAAYQHGIAYLELGTEAGAHKAIEAFGEATRLDPRYAVAYAMLAQARITLAGSYLGGEGARQAYAKARKASDTALALDPGSAVAHLVRAGLLMEMERDWSAGEAEIKRALQLAPHFASAQVSLSAVLATLGHNQRAVVLVRSALANDPRHASGYYWLAHYLAALGRLAEARQAIDTAISLSPASAGLYRELAIVEVLAGDAGAALQAAQRGHSGHIRDTAVALALQVGTDRSAADASLEALIAKYAGVAPYQIAEVYALRKDPDGMFRWLELAWTNRDPGVQYLLNDPLVLRYRNDPRFAAFCKKAGLPATTDAVAMK